MRALEAYYGGTRIFDVLLSQERTQSWLARKVGCSVSFVSRISSGERRIPVWFAEKTSAALNLPIDVLFFDLILSIESETDTENAKEIA